MMEEVFKEVGEENIVQIVTNNAAIYMAAGKPFELRHPTIFWIFVVVDDCSYMRHSPRHKPEREPLRGVCGSYLRQSWNVEMASSLQRVEKNSR
jgi:hypothetical protein